MYIRNGMKPFSALAFALTAGTVLVAQTTTGTLGGTVKEPSGAPLAGVRVTISSPELIAPRIVATGAQGEWRAPLLPPGNYKISTFFEGYVGEEAVGIRLGVGTSLRQDLLMKKAADVASAVVEIVAVSGTVDKADTKTAANFSSEQLQLLPSIGRSFSGAADLSPGVNTGANGLFSVRGGATQQTMYRLNGTDIKDDYQGSQVGTYVIADNIEDIQVVLSPLHARNGRATGGAVNVVTKSGGNDFAGSIRSTFSRPSWKARTPSYLFNPGVTTDDPNRQFEISFSGPIIKDRIWFNVGTILRPSEATSTSLGTRDTSPSGLGFQRAIYPTWTALNNAIQAGPGGGYTGVQFNDAIPYTAKTDSNYFEGKLTGSITPDHTLEVSGSNDKVEITNRNPYGTGNTLVRRLEALGTQKSVHSTLGASYRGVLSSATFLSASYNRKKGYTVFPLGDPNYGTGEIVDVYLDRPSGSHTWIEMGYPFGLGESPFPDERNSTSGNAELKLYREGLGGSHEIDLGLDYYQFDRQTSSSVGSKNQRFYVGGAFYNPTVPVPDQWLFPAIIWMPYVDVTASGVTTRSPYRFGQSSGGTYGPAPTMIEYYGRDGITKNTMTALYANDAWTINTHWNVMVGLRYDMISVKDIEGTERGKAKDLSPRLSVKYDIKGDSKHLVTLQAARYGGDFTAGFTSAFIGSATSKSAQWGFSGLPDATNPQINPHNALGVGVNAALRFLTYAQLTDPANYKRLVTHTAGSVVAGTTTYSFPYGNYNTKFNASDSSLTNEVVGDLKAEKLDEITLGYRRSYDNGSYVGMTYVYRNWRDQWAFRRDWDPANVITTYDPDLNANDYLLKTFIFNSNELVRRFNSLEVEFLSKLNATWTFGGNYAYSRLVANSPGGDQTGSSYRDNGIVGYYSFRDHLINKMNLSNNDFAPIGPHLDDQPHRARIYMMASLPLGKGYMSYSWLLKYESGANWSATQSAPISPAPVPITGLTAPTTYTQYYGGRGQYTYNDHYQMNFKIAWSVPLGIWKTQLFGDIQVNNLFNTIIQGIYSTTKETVPTGGQTYLGLDARVFGTDRRGSGNAYWYSGRSIDFSIGLKF